MPMNDEVVKRIKEIMDELSLNSLTFSKALGYSSSEKISRLFRNEKNRPSFDIIYDIANMFEINADWLVTGRGEMFFKDEETPQEETTPGISLIDKLFKTIAEKDNTIREQAETIGALKQEVKSLKTPADSVVQGAEDASHAAVG